MIRETAVDTSSRAAGLGRRGVIQKIEFSDLAIGKNLPGDAGRGRPRLPDLLRARPPWRGPSRFLRTEPAGPGTAASAPTDGGRRASRALFLFPVPRTTSGLRTRPPAKIVVIAADMDLPERILHDARRLKQELIQRLIVALRLGLDRGAGEIIDGGAEARLDLLAGNVELLGQSLETRLANSVALITGALPAQYGLRTAGIVDIQTKTGTLNPSGSVTLYGGQQQWFQGDGG